MPRDPGDICNNCYFAQGMPELAEPLIFCMRFPPSIDYIDQAGRALSRPRTTHRDWWCGEHKPQSD